MARAFGSEKGLKEPLAGFRVHAMAIVRHDQQHAREEDGTLAAAARGRPGYSLKPAVTGLNHNAPAARQSIAGIENQVEDYLLGLRLIDFDQTQIGIEPEFQLNVFADQAG